MKVLKEDVSTRAWMIRNDGKEFPVTTHYYGSRDPQYTEETIYASEWLYGATNHTDVKDNIIKLKPKKIIYVSCNPMTLVRDLNKFELYNILELTQESGTTFVSFMIE